jgi:hypothetical protein
MQADPELVADVRRIMTAFGLELGAADYVVEPDGTRHLLEFNHIPNVTQFPEIRAAYLEFVADWLHAADRQSPTPAAASAPAPPRR